MEFFKWMYSESSRTLRSSNTHELSWNICHYSPEGKNCYMNLPKWEAVNWKSYGQTLDSSLSNIQFGVCMVNVWSKYICFFWSVNLSTFRQESTSEDQLLALLINSIESLYSLFYTHLSSFTSSTSFPLFYYSKMHIT